MYWPSGAWVRSANENPWTERPATIGGSPPLYADGPASAHYPFGHGLSYTRFDYEGLRKEQAEKRARGELMGIGITTFTEIVGAGPTRNCDILGVGMFDSAEIRVHPTGSVIARMGTITQGQGHQTTYAQIIASELGIPSDEIQIEEGDTDTAPYGLGTYGSRSTPVGGAATAQAARKIKAKARKIAAHLLEEGLHAVIVSLAPAVERVIVTLGALRAETHEHLGYVLGCLQRVAFDLVEIRGRAAKGPSGGTE